MLKTLLRSGVIFGLLLAALLAACSPAQPVPTAQVVTVVNTVPVEVTRLVEVERTVEVTRIVVETQVLEVPVTTTPLPTEAATATPAPTASPTFSLTGIPSPTFAIPSEKTAGWSLLKTTNLSEQSLTVELSGPVYQSFSLSAGDFDLRNIPEGHYTYAVSLLEGGKRLYSGTVFISNPDKFELKLRMDKAQFLVP